MATANSSSASQNSSEQLKLIIAAGRGEEGEVGRLVRSVSASRRIGGRLRDEDRAAVQGLLERTTEMERFTALHVAAIAGHSGVVGKLVVAIRSLGMSEQQTKELVNARDSMERTPLHYAAWKQRGAVMKDLLSYTEVDRYPEDKDGFTPVHLVLIGCSGDVEVLRPLLGRIPDVELDRVATQTENTKRLANSTQLPGVPLPSPSDYNFEDFGNAITPMKLIVPNDLESRTDDLGMLKTVWGLENRAVERKIVNEIEKQLRPNVRGKLQGSPDVSKFNAMHLAAVLGLPIVIKILATSPEFLAYINEENSCSQTPLHLAAQENQLEVVRCLNHQRTLRGAVEDNSGRTAVQIAFENKSNSIVRILMQRPDVKDYVQIQHADRSVYVDGTNAILVGAALIASITFAGWLQPPLGYQQYHSDSPVFEQYAAIGGHTSIKIFWISNSLSFYFAIAAILAGAGAVVPRRDLFIKAEVIRVKGALSMISLAFAWAVVFVVVAFTAAGYASLPPVTRYELYMILTMVVGFFACYFTFGIARSSNPSQFSRYYRYIDPGFYVSKSLAFIGRYIIPKRF